MRNVDFRNKEGPEGDNYRVGEGENYKGNKGEAKEAKVGVYLEEEVE